MPVYNVTVDDASPFFLYQGAWGDSSLQDPSHDLYANDTFHATEESGATVTVNFYGSAVSLYGARRGNHGTFSVAIDGSAPVNGFGGAAPDEFQTLLFETSGLSLTQHAVVLTDTSVDSSRPFVDVDFAIITTGDGNSLSNSTDTIYDDQSSVISYDPSWQTSSDPSYFQGTLHSTNTPGSSATISFSGNAIAVYGGTSPQHGLFSVSLDGQVPVTHNGTAPSVRPQNLLYYASGLSDDKHELVFSNLGGGSASLLDLDKVVTTSWGERPSPSNQRAVAIAAVLGTVGFLLLVACIAWVLLRRRRQRRAEEQHQNMHGWSAYNISARSSRMGISATDLETGQPGWNPNRPLSSELPDYATAIASGYGISKGVGDPVSPRRYKALSEKSAGDELGPSDSVSNC